MAQHEISASALIQSPAELVYAIIADYHNGHPLILPKPYFVSMQVEQGGIGSGTVVSWKMKLMGTLREFRAVITEPEPGRVLVETNDGGGAVTKFVVDPRNGGQAAVVTISTSVVIRDGILGKLEGWMTTNLLHPIYVKELEQLNMVAANWKIKK